LNLHGVGAGADKGFDLQVLFQRLKKQYAYVVDSEGGVMYNLIYGRNHFFSHIRGSLLPISMCRKDNKVGY